MNTKSLFLACTATALLGCPALASGCEIPSASTKIVSKVLKDGDIDRGPVVINSVIPEYPLELREVEIEGIATVDLKIDSTGRVVSAELVKATVPELGRLAVAAAKQWTFVPASAKGKPIASRVRVPFEFSMPELVAINRR